MQPNSDIQQRDINDVFSDLLLSEEQLIEEGYAEGHLTGISEGKIEGFHLGYHRGAEIGAELGYYLGVVESLRMVKTDDARFSKNRKHLTELISLIESFPKTNSKEVNYLELLDNIRILFKKTCALLKIDSSYPEVDKLTF